MSVLEELLCAGGFKVVGRAEHSFPEPGGGFTGLFLLSESHASVHTYPEHGYAAVDLFSCGPVDPTPTLEALALKLGAERHELKTFTRGERQSSP